VSTVASVAPIQIERCIVKTRPALHTSATPIAASRAGSRRHEAAPISAATAQT
jgi:hypothetical protein